MKVTRLQIELDEKQMKELQALMDEGGVRTKRELFNIALSLLKWAVRQRKAGRTIASIDEATDQYRELDMPILSEIQADRAAG